MDEYLNPEVLTIGFARRFATYKRATLLFRDRERLSRLVNDPYRPVRFIFAGKPTLRIRQARNLLNKFMIFPMSPI